MTGAASPWGRKRNTDGTREYRSPVDWTDTSQWRCHNYSCGRIIGPIPTDRPRSISRRSVSSLMIFEECTCTSKQWPAKNGYEINTLGMSSLYVTFCGQAMHGSRVRVCSMSRIHLWPRVNPPALRERVQQVHFSVSFGLESSGTIQCYLTGWLFNDIVVLCKRLWRGCLKLCLLLCGRVSGFNTTELQHTAGKTSATVCTRYIQEGGLDLEGRLRVLGRRI